MTDPNYMHEFWPNRKGTCQLVVSGKHCGLSETAQVHARFKAKQKEAAAEIIAEANKVMMDKSKTLSQLVSELSVDDRRSLLSILIRMTLESGELEPSTIRAFIDRLTGE